MGEPLSKLTRERPDIWIRALELATGLTGYSYPHKAPLSDGTLSACGGYIPKRPKTIDEQIEELNNTIEYWEDRLKDYEKRQQEEGVSYQDLIEKYKKQIEEMKERLDRLNEHTKRAYVPEGEMEWLLHEVGHWIAATPAERALPNYGYGQAVLLNGLGAAREWQAWGFEEIVLAPYGPSRLLASPTQRDGVAFSTGRFPHHALRHAETRIGELAIDIGEWSSIYGEWVHWRKPHDD